MITFQRIKDNIDNTFKSKTSRSWYLIICIVLYAILHKLLAFIFPNIFWGYKALFLLFILFFFSGIIIFYRKYIIQYLTVEINPKYITLSRVLYSVVSLFTAVQHLTLIPSGLEPFNARHFNLEDPVFAYGLTFLYIFGLLLLLLGKHIRLAWIIVFFAGVYVIPFSLEIFLKNTIAFYAIFIPQRLWKGESVEEKCNGTGILLMGISLAFLMTSAGIFKLLDPIWQEGLGLYYSLNIPFFTPKHLWSLLEWEWGIEFLNYITILVEVVSLPLFLFRKTRFLGVLTILMLGLFLTYPMAGIGLVGGPLVLTMVPLFISMFLKTKNKYLSTQRHLVSFKDPNYRVKFVSIALFVFTFIGIYAHSANEFSKYFYKYPKYGPYTIKENGPLVKFPAILKWRLQTLTFFTNKTRPPKYFESIWCIPLFDYYHLFDRVVFKIKFIDKENNRSQEPMSFFNENGTYHKDYPLLFNERFLISCWKIMMMKQYSENGTVPIHIYNDFRNEFHGIRRFSEKALNKEINLDEFQVWVKEIHQPYSYQGNEKPWVKKPFKLLYTYYYSSESDSLDINNIETFNYSKLEIEPFQKGIISPNF